MESKITYPVECAPRGDTVDEYKVNDKYPCQVADPYRFMEDPDAEATKKWVAAQNVVTDAFLGQCDQRSKLKEKITQCWNYPKRGIPKKRGDHYYFFYNTGLQNQNIMYKITAPNTYKTDDADPLAGTTVFLDPNALAEDGTASLGSQVWSDDGKYNAYQVKRSGSDWATIHVREADTGKDLENDVLSWVKFSGMSWTGDNKGFFYSKFDAPKDQDQTNMDNKAGKETEKLEYQKVFYHRVGTK
jgi:prolyl oligopeptidase